MATSAPARAIMCEIDGVIASVEWRLHHLDDPEPSAHSWERFYKGIADDPLIVATATQLAAVPTDIPIVVCTSRPESYRRVTMAWLTHHQVRVDALVMRFPRDHRPPATAKAHLYTELIAPKYTVTAVYESDPACIEMWTARQLPVLAVHDPFVTPDPALAR